MLKLILTGKYKLFVLIVLIIFANTCFGYAVLTHEALVDASWESSLLPLLKKRFPSANTDDLTNSKAYAYGGAVCPDMGYYPFGNALFTNLVHYVRSGTMVNNLLKDSKTLNEYAFALGFLCHYNADEYGHPIGTNVSVPLVYPKVKAKFGNYVTYAEDKMSHLRMEFAFDVLETARGNFASKSYHDFIGFKVDTSVLARSFENTYGLKLEDLFKNRFTLAVETFRWSVKNLIPFVTRVAWASKKNDIRKTNPTATARNFRYHMLRKEYRKEFGTNYQKPGLFTSVVALLIRIVPKIGPLRVLKFKPPTPDAEAFFIKSFDTVQSHYKADVAILSNRKIQFPNIDFDTGNHTVPGEYSLADESYRQLLLKLSDDKFSRLNQSLKEDLLVFFNKAESRNYKADTTGLNKALTGLRNQKTFN